MQEYNLITRRVIEGGVVLRLVFADSDVEKVCTDRKVAKKLFGGNEPLVRSLFARLSFLESARRKEEVRRYPGVRFHSPRNMEGGNLEGFFRC